MNDVLHSYGNYVAGSLTYDGIDQTAANDTDNLNYNSTNKTISGTVSSLELGQEVAITFKVNPDASIKGYVLQNVASLTPDDHNIPSVTPPPPTTTYYPLVNYYIVKNGQIILTSFVVRLSY